MEDKAYIKKTEEMRPSISTGGQDLATILSQLPGSGADDDVTRLMNIYEAGERSYRAAIQASLPTVYSSASTSL